MSHEMNICRPILKCVVIDEASVKVMSTICVRGLSHPLTEPSLGRAMISLVYYTSLPWRSADWHGQKLEGLGLGQGLQGNQVGTAVVAQAVYL